MKKESKQVSSQAFYAPVLCVRKPYRRVQISQNLTLGLNTIQGLDTSVMSMLNNVITSEGETKKGKYTENELYTLYGDPLEQDTLAQQKFINDLYDNIKQHAGDTAENEVVTPDIEPANKEEVTTSVGS